MKEAIMQKKKRVNFDIPLEIHTSLKIAATSCNMSLKMFILRLILEELAKMGLIKVK